MDQLKVFLKQAVKYRFWIAFGVSLLLPMIGFIVGAETINTETTKREGEIKSANTEVGKYTSGALVNAQYQPLATTKKEALTQDVNAAWRKLFATQEPLLKWPPEVQERFRKWGRQYPKDVNKNQVQSTIIDYTVSYPAFAEKIYKVFNPFNFDDGSGIVVAPDPAVLLATATFSQDNPPDLTKIWAEQERLWVVTALLDAVAKVNEGVGAKDWDGAVVKQINLLDVGDAIDQDQKSIAKGETLVPADVLAEGGTPGSTPAPAAPAATGIPSLDPTGGSKGKEVLYLKTDSQQFKALPIKMTVLVDQARLANFLVGLENSPMAIEVNEVEIAKPVTPVAKPAYGEKEAFNPGGGMSGGSMTRAGESQAGPRGRNMAGGMNNRMPGYPGGGAGIGAGEMAGGGRAGFGAGAGPKASGGVDNRGKNDAQARKDREKKEREAASKAKGETKKIDQYYNVIEVTVYGRARFYLAPPAPAQPAPSTASEPSPAPAAPAQAPPAGSNPTPDAAKVNAAPAQPAATKAEPSNPEALAPKAEATEPKGEAPKGDAPKAEPPKNEAPAPKT